MEEEIIKQPGKRGRPKKVESQDIFVGFTMEDIKGNYVQFPIVWIDILASIDNMAELKVVLYVMRHTWGFKEYEESKRIAVDEFMHGRKQKGGRRMDRGTSLSESAVQNGIKKAIEHGFLECEQDDSDKARIKKYYKLKLQNAGQDEIKTEGKFTYKEKSLASSPSMPKQTYQKPQKSYSEYLLSPEWQKKRNQALRFANFRCQVCNAPDNLNVHHRTYERLGNEKLNDLTVLCQDCHSIFHANTENM